MAKLQRSEIPMETIEDLRDWHQSQVERFERLAATRKVELTRYERTLQRGDLRNAEFHRKAMRAAQNAIADLKQYLG